MMEKIWLLVIVSSYLLNFVNSSGIQSIMTNKVEFKTEAPKDVQPNVKRDCYEYIHGRLSEIRQHGTTWQNGVSDCSNCTCDNGDIRCFFHFCKGPSTGYMTPPSTNKNAPSVPEDDMLMEESSGFPPPGLGAVDGTYDDEDSKAIASEKKESNHIDIDEDEVFIPNTIATDAPIEMNLIIVDQSSSKGGKWPPKVVPEKWQKEVSETSSPPSVEVRHSKEKEKKNRAENETHDVFKSHFCGKPCKRVCPRGYRVDLLTGCWKCKCNRCQVICTNKCPSGYVLDEHGCDTCVCAVTQSSFSTDEDITFKEDPEDAVNLKDEALSSTSVSELKKTSNELGFFDEYDDDEEYSQVQVVSSEEEEEVPETTSKGSQLIRDMFQTTQKDHEEPCNTTDKTVFPVNEELVTADEPEQKLPVDGGIFMDEPFFDEPLLKIDDDQAIVKSIPKEDNNRTLLAILLPCGVICGLVVFLLVHMWRRYHSDKYDINAYRPEEKQKLRPVKTLNDDQTSLKHV